MRAKLLGIVLTTPIAISSFASTETLSFTPDNINADIRSEERRVGKEC